MNEYTPTTDDMRTSWHRNSMSYGPGERAAEFDRFIAKVKADERRSLLEELTTDAEQEASIGRQGNDRERVNAAEKIIEMLNDIRIEREV